MGAAGEGSAWTELRVCVGRQAPGRVTPLPVIGTDLGLPAGSAFFAVPLPLKDCGKLRWNGFLGETDLDWVGLSAACIREDDRDLSCNSVSSNTCGVSPERALLLLFLPRSPELPVPEDADSIVGREVSESSSLAELSLPPAIAGMARLPKVAVESADSEALVIA